MDLDETAGVTTQEASGSHPDIVEGSDSERTGTSWGLPGVEGGRGREGEEEGQAHPNRNTGTGVAREDLDNVGSWSTIDKADSAGSPTGNS